MLQRHQARASLICHPHCPPQLQAMGLFVLASAINRSHFLVILHTHKIASGLGSQSVKLSIPLDFDVAFRTSNGPIDDLNLQKANLQFDNIPVDALFEEGIYLDGLEFDSEDRLNLLERKRVISLLGYIAEIDSLVRLRAYFENAGVLGVVLADVDRKYDVYVLSHRDFGVGDEIRAVGPHQGFYIPFISGGVPDNQLASAKFGALYFVIPSVGSGRTFGPIQCLCHPYHQLFLIPGVLIGLGLLDGADEADNGQVLLLPAFELLPDLGQHEAVLTVFIQFLHAVNFTQLDVGVFEILVDNPLDGPEMTVIVLLCDVNQLGEGLQQKVQLVGGLIWAPEVQDRVQMGEDVLLVLVLVLHHPVEIFDVVFLILRVRHQDVLLFVIVGGFKCDFHQTPRPKLEILQQMDVAHKLSFRQLDDLVVSFLLVPDDAFLLGVLVRVGDNNVSVVVPGFVDELHSPVVANLDLHTQLFGQLLG